MKYAKRIDDRHIELAPQNKGAIINYNTNVELMTADGYKMLIEAEIPVTNRLFHIEYQETAKRIREIITYDETQEEADAREAQAEHDRIQALYMTRSDFFDGLIRAFGVDEDMLLPVLQQLLATLPIDETQKKIALNNFKNALNFYRKHDLFTLLSGVTIPVTQEISITVSAEQWDRFFDETDKKNPDAYKELLPQEVEE